MGILNPITASWVHKTLEQLAYLDSDPALLDMHRRTSMRTRLPLSLAGNNLSHFVTGENFPDTLGATPLAQRLRS